MVSAWKTFHIVFEAALGVRPSYRVCLKFKKKKKKKEKKSMKWNIPSLPHLLSHLKVKEVEHFKSALFLWIK